MIFACLIYYSYQYAIAGTTTTNPKLYGSKATINVWDPAIEEGAEEMSISQIWVAAGGYKSGDLNTIEVGWQVSINYMGLQIS